MEKRKINSFLLAMFVAILAIILTNLLQYLVINHITNYIADNAFSMNQIENYDTIMNTLISSAKRSIVLNRIIDIIRDIIVYIIIYKVIKFLGKKYYVSILKANMIIFTIFVVDLIPVAIRMIRGAKFNIAYIIYAILNVIIYFIFIYKFLIDKNEVEKVLNIREELKSEKKWRKKGGYKAD